jgi:hypothetical protein
LRPRAGPQQPLRWALRGWQSKSWRIQPPASLTQLPGIAEALTKASQDTFQCLTGNAVTRDDTIGMGQIGPSKSIADISWVHFSLLKDLSFEVSNGSKLLQLTLNEFEYHENANASDLAQVESDLARGSGYKPWDRIAEAVPEVK